MWLAEREEGEIFVAYISVMWFTKRRYFDGLHKQFKNSFWVEFPKKEILMYYISRSCDLFEASMGAILTAYISRSCDLPKKEILIAYISGI